MSGRGCSFASTHIIPYKKRGAYGAGFLGGAVLIKG